jgi:Rhomboid family
MGVMMLYTMHFPLEEICVFWFFPLQMRWLMTLYVIFELHPLLLALSGDRLWSGIAHSAHLGGLAFGFLYARYEWRLETILDRMTAFSFRWRRARRLHLVPAEPAESNPDPDSAKIDELLDKILASGESSLTEEEREVLPTASARRKNRSVREPRG